MTSAPPPASRDLEPLLAQRLAAGGRVLVIGPTPEVAAALKANGCTLVTEGPETSVGTVDQVVVATPPPTRAGLQSLFERCARLAPAAPLLVLAWNASSATALLRLVDRRGLPEGACADEDLELALRAAGYRVDERVAVPWVEANGLAGDTRAALSQLFVQLNPTATEGRTLTVASRGQATVTPTYEPGLLSVVMRNHSLARLELIDAAIFSLACQSYHPLEIIVVTQSTDADAGTRLEALLERHRGVGQYRSRVVRLPSSTDIRARLVNEGARVAAGQYLALLDDDDVVYPDHYVRLVGALQESENAWAFARTRRAYFTTGRDGVLHCVRKDHFPRSEAFDFFELAYDNYVTCHSYVIDRTRLGKFAFGFEESLTKGEDYTFLLRLLALFRPVAVGGHATCEYRIRDDGTNTIIHDTHLDGHRERLIEAWNAAIEKAQALRSPVQMLMSYGEFTPAYARVRPRQAGVPEPRPPQLRYRVADAINDALKQRLSLLHRAVRAVAFLREPKGEPSDSTSKPGDT